jgi:hypothetical protein
MACANATTAAPGDVFLARDDQGEQRHQDDAQQRQAGQPRRDHLVVEPGGDECDQERCEHQIQQERAEIVDADDAVEAGDSMVRARTRTTN